MKNINEIYIKGLFGRHDIRVPIRDNRLIIVGVNGIGKSTVLNILYFFISRQWEKLADIEFDTIKIKIGRQTLSVDHASLRDYVESLFRLRILRTRRPSSRMLEKLLSEISARDISYFQSRKPSMALFQEMSSRFKIPLRASEDLFFSLRHGVGPDEQLKDFEFIGKVESALTESIQGRILYLPTYRRIERDIKKIFPNIEERIQDSLISDSPPDEEDQVYVELVRFGMEDVLKKLNKKMSFLRDYRLSEISGLTTRYLRDVIRNEANKFDETRVRKISDSDLQRIFASVDKTILEEKDQAKIYEVVHKIKNRHDIFENEQYVAHYISSLVDIAENIEEEERDVQLFVAICNQYLFEKSLNFDRLQYQISVHHRLGNKIDLKDLSSGEKQIVSLFAHLLLDNSRGDIVLIDEPELSLSVDWQQRFLEDISNLETCRFIGAVTHSPFIFENSLDCYAVDLLAHTRDSDQ